MLDFIRNLFKRFRKPKKIICYECHYYSTARGVRCNFDGSYRPRKTECSYFKVRTKIQQPSVFSGVDEFAPIKKRPKAVHQDLSKFFKGKGGRHHKEYRRTLKRKISPEDEE